MSKEDDFVTAQRAEIVRIAVSLGVSEQVASLIGAEWDQRTRREWGRCEPYVAAKPHEKEQVKRQAAEEARRSGKVVETADRYGISRATMYRLLKK